MSLLNVPGVKPQQLQPWGVWFLSSCGMLLGTMGMFFLRFLSAPPRLFISVWQMGKKIHVTEKKLSQDMRRWTSRGHCFIHWVNAKIRLSWKILLFTFSGSLEKSWSGKHQITLNGRICIFCGFIFAANVVSLLSLSS